MSETPTSLENFLLCAKLKKQEFPLESLLTLYSRLQNLEYSARFDAMRELIKWLSPITRSTKQSKYIPIYFCTFEIKEIARYLGEEPSKIWQELESIWTRDSLTYPTQGFSIYTVARANTNSPDSTHQLNKKSL